MQLCRSGEELLADKAAAADSRVNSVHSTFNTSQR